MNALRNLPVSRTPSGLSTNKFLGEGIAKPVILVKVKAFVISKPQRISNT